MATSYGALCTDFYINQKLSLKLDLPSERETLLHFMDQVRKAQPTMERFRRFDGELVLETSRKEAEYRWLTLRQTSIRTGHVNPDSMASGYALHRYLLQTAPMYLSISPLDIDYIELTFGFDLECEGNHDQVIYDALFADTPLGSLMQIEGTQTLDVQPLFGVNLSEDGSRQAHFEVKTRQKSRRGSSQAHRDEPIALFLTLRQYGPIAKIDDLISIQVELSEIAEQLANDKLVPDLLTPIAQHITPRSL